MIGEGMMELAGAVWTRGAEMPVPQRGNAPSIARNLLVSGCSASVTRMPAGFAASLRKAARG